MIVMHKRNHIHCYIYTSLIIIGGAGGGNHWYCTFVCNKERDLKFIRSHRVEIGALYITSSGTELCGCTLCDVIFLEQITNYHFKYVMFMGYSLYIQIPTCDVSVLGPSFWTGYALDYILN